MAREGLNKVILIGNLGQDPELKYTQGGQAMLRLSLATSESYMSRTGERQEKTEWHRIVVWGKRAEALGKFLTKGRTLCVEGSIQYHSWEDNDGNKRYSTQIRARNIILLGGGQGRGDYGGGGGQGGGGGGDDFGGGGYGGGGGGYGGGGGSQGGGGGQGGGGYGGGGGDRQGGGGQGGGSQGGGSQGGGGQGGGGQGGGGFDDFPADDFGDDEIPF